MQLITPFVSTIIGKVKSGKSHLIKYLLYNLQNSDNEFDVVIIFTKNIIL